MDEQANKPPLQILKLRYNVLAGCTHARMHAAPVHKRARSAVTAALAQARDDPCRESRVLSKSPLLTMIHSMVAPPLKRIALLKNVKTSRLELF
jgi:hypothetical protein